MLLAGCFVSSHVGVGVMNTGMGQPRRDPDPRRDPNAEQATSPWVPESEAARPGTRRYELERGLATIAAVLAGAAPMLTWYGTFDENLLAPKRARPATKRGSSDSDQGRAPRPPQHGYDFDPNEPATKVAPQR